jgi:hypothetical protein
MPRGDAELGLGGERKGAVDHPGDEPRVPGVGIFFFVALGPGSELGEREPVRDAGGEDPAGELVAPGHAAGLEGGTGVKREQRGRWAWTLTMEGALVGLKMGPFRRWTQEIGLRLPHLESLCLSSNA